MAEARRLTQVAAVVTDATTLPAGPLVVALSGGADSAALAWIARRGGADVRALHVHHGFPGSDSMAAAAVEVARAVGIDLAVLVADVEAGSSPEARARTARYQALEAGLRPDEWLLTAHTSDDQAETVLDHLFRSSGTDGLAGIPRRRGPIARPFLAVSRSQTRELAALAGLPWQDDPANVDLDPLRNRIRSRLIPRLEETFAPNLRAGLARTAELIAIDAAHMDTEMAATAVFETAGGWEVAAAAIATAPTALAARLTRRLLALAGLPAASTDAVAGVAAVASGRVERHRPGRGIDVRRRGAMLRVETAREPVPEPRPLAVPGSTPFGAWQFQAAVFEHPPTAMPLSPAWMVADLDAVGEFRIEAGALHPPTLALLAAAGVGLPERGRHPIVVGAGKPMWIPGVRRLEAGWADAGTDRYLVVRTRVDRTCLRYEL